MVERLGRHDKGGGVGGAELESGGGGAESGWKTRERLKTPTDRWGRDGSETRREERRTVRLR